MFKNAQPLNQNVISKTLLIERRTPFRNLYTACEVTKKLLYLHCTANPHQNFSLMKIDFAKKVKSNKQENIPYYAVFKVQKVAIKLFFCASKQNMNGKKNYHA